MEPGEILDELAEALHVAGVGPRKRYKVYLSMLQTFENNREDWNPADYLFFGDNSDEEYRRAHLKMYPEETNGDV